MSEMIFGADDEERYRPKLAQQYRIAFLIITLGALLVFLALQAFSPWFHGAALPGGKAFVRILIAFLFLGFGILMLVGAMRGLPRLTLTQDGIEFETVFSTKWANWNSLSAFALTTNYVGLFNRRRLTASADIAGPSVSRNLLRTGKFVIPDVFLAAVDRIVADLNAQQRRVLGVSRVAPTDSRPQDGNTFGLAEFTAPWLTFVMLAVLVIIFAEEQLRGLGPGGPMMSPSLATLTAMGASSRALVLSNGEWYRLFTAPLLHGDLSHIVGNGFALIIAGCLLERLVGRAWYLAVFVIGGLSGSVLSLAVNPATLPSVGASGAIMGLFAACFTASFRVPAGATRKNLQLQSMFVLVPSLLPLATAGHIDYGAHLGGGLAGTAVMLFLLKSWSDTDRMPPSRHFATGIAAIGVILFGASFAVVASNYPDTKSRAVLIPPSEVPKTEAEWQSRAADLVARFPQDPRAHTYRGIGLAQAKDYVGAERELRTALTQTEDLHAFFPPKFENVIRAMLALILSEDNRWSAGKEVALPACRAQPADRPPEQLQKALYDQHLCNG
jgi:rhomboid protease GluP